MTRPMLADALAHHVWATDKILEVCEKLETDQLGTTADVSSPAAGCGLESIIGTREADWIAANSWKFGFIVSYPNGKEGVTGYAYEPWHVRYIGRGDASKVNASGLTLTEYLGKR